jgi:predicted DNA-binding transcriptional regulator YafY
MNDKKSRILHIKRFLEAQTDETHPATAADIIEHLKSIGITASRKAITSDIERLIEFGVDVVCDEGKRNEYFIGERRFELPELKLLVDAVQASRFISPSKVKKLLGKLTALASVHQADELNRQLYTDTLPGEENRVLFITINLLYSAINSNLQITLKYYDYDQHKRKVYKHGRKVYRFSPYGMIWSDGHYYVVGYEASHGKVITLRVDRIAAAELTDKTAEYKPDGFDMTFYARSVFNMFDGEVQAVTLRCENELMKSVIDRFGEDVHTEVTDAEHFTVTADIPASPTFFGWVFSFGGRMDIAEPENVKNAYLGMFYIVPREGA